MEAGLVILVFWAAMAGLGMYISNAKGREVGEGLLLGLCFGPLGVLIAALLPTVQRVQVSDEERQRVAAEESARVADFVKRQAEGNKRFSDQLELERKRAEFDRQTKEHEKRERREARDDYYRSRGVEPGLFAWFKVLPDLVQALAFGLTLGMPILVGFGGYGLVQHWKSEAEFAKQEEGIKLDRERREEAAKKAANELQAREIEAEELTKLQAQEKPVEAKPPTAVSKLDQRMVDKTELPKESAPIHEIEGEPQVLSERRQAAVEKLAIGKKHQANSDWNLATLYYKDVMAMVPDSPLYVEARDAIKACEEKMQAAQIIPKVKTQRRR